MRPFGQTNSACSPWVFGVIGRTRANALVGLGLGQALARLVLGAVTLAIMVVTTMGWILLSIPTGYSYS